MTTAKINPYMIEKSLKSLIQLSQNRILCLSFYLRFVAVNVVENVMKSPHILQHKYGWTPLHLQEQAVW